MNDKPLVYSLAALFVGVAIPASGFAQSAASGLPDPTVSSLDARLEDSLEERRDFEWTLRLTGEAHTTDNASLRKLDETRGDQERRETDDRHSFGFTAISAGINYRLVDDVTFRFSGAHRGAWGSNQLGGNDDAAGFLYVGDLSVDWTALDTGAFSFGVRVGRQPYAIGGARNDYFFRDTVDGVVFDVGFAKPAGKLRILGFDIAAVGGRPDTVTYLNLPRDTRSVQNMRGQTNTMRFGAVYENTGLVDGLEFRAFGYYASLGGVGTASDRTHTGTLANFADNDFNWLAGTRIGYFLDFGASRVGGYGEFAHSGGIDRKDTRDGQHDVVVEGNAFGGALVADLLFDRLMLDATLQFFRADGASYGADGMRFSHGFVGFKGSQAGGLNMADYTGWRPSAYIGSGGVHHNEHDLRRESGTQMLHFGLGFGLVDTLKLDLGVWHFTDTSSTNMHPDDVPALASRLPSGFSEDDLHAQERLGKALGTELNARLTFNATSNLSFYGMGGVFLPGEFYEIEITRKVGSARGSDDPQNFWAIGAGTALTF